MIAALERRLNPPSKPREWATFTEVTDGAQRRRVDFLAVNMWISRGRRVHGYEVKVRRADWLKELRSPKADAWFGVANSWSLVAPQGVVGEGELPSSWGFMELLRSAGGWKLHEKVPAPPLTPTAESPWWLLQRLLSRVEDVRKAAPPEIDAAREEGYANGLARGEANARYAPPSDEARKELDALLDALGPGLPWRKDERIPQLNRALRLLATGQIEQQALRTAERFRHVAAMIEAAVKDEPPPPDEMF